MAYFVNMYFSRQFFHDFGANIQRLALNLQLFRHLTKPPFEIHRVLKDAEVLD